MAARADSFPEAYVANGEKNPELQKGLERVCSNKVTAEMMDQGNMVINVSRNLFEEEGRLKDPSDGERDGSIVQEVEQKVME